jgi:hypothetical protein
MVIADETATRWTALVIQQVQTRIENRCKRNVAGGVGLQHYELKDLSLHIDRLPIQPFLPATSHWEDLGRLVSCIHFYVCPMDIPGSLASQQSLSTHLFHTICQGYQPSLTPTPSIRMSNRSRLVSLHSTLAIVRVALAFRVLHPR